jgi:hypothetical protein
MALQKEIAATRGELAKLPEGVSMDAAHWLTQETALLERIVVENELRHRIAAVFATEEIVMAFPQRDVHLETTRPLQVVITPATGDGVGPPPVATEARAAPAQPPGAPLGSARPSPTST